jgi:adenylate cyclase
MRTRRLYRTMLVLAGAAVVALAVVGYGLDVFKRGDLATVDARFSVRGPQKPPADIVFVKIDDDTFNHIRPIRFPFPRGYHAKVIRHLAEAGAKVIAYDVQFTEPGPDPRQDDLLIDSVREAGNVVLATTEIDKRGRTRIFGGGEGLKYSRAIPSFSEFPTDPGGIIRRFEYENTGLASFPAAAARAFLGHPIAHSPGETAWIDYPGPPGQIRSIPFWRVMKGKFDRGDVFGKVVIVGASAPSLQDRHPTATTKRDPMPGPEIHAAAIDTILSDSPLHTADGWVNIFFIVLLGMAAPLLALRITALKASLITLVLVGGYAVLTQAMFEDGVIVSTVYAGLAALLSTVATMLLYGVTTAFERERTREVFARFVPESVVGQVLGQADGARLGGTRRAATVLFSDLRGFTSFAERREPDEVIAILNRYLTAMSDAILDNGGTLVAYMGDGIMAVFGAPIEQEDHADRALSAACDMLTRFDDFNDWLRAEGHSARGFKMGIGLNSGSVMSGNVGSERRLEYTAIGDTTNTAARLEGMTKGTPWQLYLSDSTRELLTRRVEDLEEVGEFEVRGREARIRLWTLPSTAHEDDRIAETVDEPTVSPTA